MPRYAVKGGSVTLRCNYSVKPEHLHKVEWLKGEDKLVQYVKGRKPAFRAWEIPGAKLHKDHYDEKHIRLSNLTFAASGSYYCIVSMETPSIFTKDSESKDLTIIDPQEYDPKITFEKETYFVGETLKANCTTAPAKPPPHITWLMNDEKVRDSLTKSYSNGIVHGHGYFETKAPSIKQLSIEVSQLHAGEDGRLRLTCVATIPGYVSKDSDYADIRNSTALIEILEIESPALPSPVEAASSSQFLRFHVILLVILVLTTYQLVYGKLVKKRIEEEYWDMEAEEQAGFRAGRCTVDHLFTLTQIIEKKMARNQEIHLLCVDLKKPYDSVPQSKLWEALEHNIN
ncbi:uncharacterized protein LOC115884377 [Sitophilus oryzae]|uniref:Uncharacterized protein LOC115884377 n=1 Tax=Sitophilus oryzae TaxID=7048 RepID=A0A6J2Y564_SITOR|nr:uncharacterized protein LOC115884377 [Sitophilus oryzae]